MLDFSGVGKGLLYMEKLYDQYIDEGVDPARLNIHGVFLGSLIYNSWDLPTCGFRDGISLGSIVER